MKSNEDKTKNICFNYQISEFKLFKIASNYLIVTNNQ